MSDYTCAKNDLFWSQVFASFFCKKIIALPLPGFFSCEKMMHLGCKYLHHASARIYLHNHCHIELLAPGQLTLLKSSSSMIVENCCQAPASQLDNGHNMQLFSCTAFAANICNPGASSFFSSEESDS